MFYTCFVEHVETVIVLDTAYRPLGDIKFRKAISQRVKFGLIKSLNLRPNLTLSAIWTRIKSEV